MKKHNTRTIRKRKRKLTPDNASSPLQMLTCYDYQTARILNETNLDLILVGDSVGNVVLGYDSTVSVTATEMKIFASAVRRGAPNKFIVVDLPFGTYNTLEEGLKNATEIFQATGAEAIKLEGAFPYQLELVERLTQVGIPVMGHIGLTPQSVHQQGGYYTHGKTHASSSALEKAAKDLESAGAFALVLECVEAKLAGVLTDMLTIPTIGIGSGTDTDGQVLVINDLLQMGDKAPSFCEPIANLRELKQSLIEKYLAGK